MKYIKATDSKVEYVARCHKCSAVFSTNSLAEDTETEYGKYDGHITYKIICPVCGATLFGNSYYDRSDKGNLFVSAEIVLYDGQNETKRISI